MKCPKCHYLGFDTGARCKHCGYDFSLMAEGAGRPGTDPGDMPLRVDSGDAPVHPGLPLFADATDDPPDEPLIRMPAAPRAPLAVRRTPEIPRLRAVPRPVRRAEPVLEFQDDGEPAASARATVPAPAASAPVPSPVVHPGPGGGGVRCAAMAIDHLILFAIDLVVVYFTLRIAGLPMADWRTLPVGPLTMFLLFVKLGYFCTFTAVGGQTIGKMAVRIRVVTDTGEAVDGVRAIQRAAAATVSALVFGLGYIPALAGGEHRALHDRVAHTRVVALRSA